MAETPKKKTSSTKTASAEKPAAAAKPRKAAAKKSANGAAADSVSVHGHAVAHEDVARLAHRYWQERGHKHGHHEEDWYRAEQELGKRAS